MSKISLYEKRYSLMAKNQAVSAQKKEKTSSISVKLTRVLIPVVAAAIVLVVALSAINATKIITSLAEDDLQKTSDYNATNLSIDVVDFESKFDGIVDGLNTVAFANDDAIQEYLAPSASYYDFCAGVYMGLSDNTFLSATGKKSGDFVATDRQWYKDGMANSGDSLVIGNPYTDADGSTIMITICKKVTLKDGREGVAAADLKLNTFVDRINQYKPLTTGDTMLFDGDYILSYFHSDLNGTKIADANDSFLNMLQPLMSSTTVQTVKSYDGNTYMLAFSSVPGTNWTLVSSVNKKSVLSSVTAFTIFSIIIGIVVAAVIALLLVMLIRKLVSKPVSDLTKNITKVADGDFTVKIKANGNDEIGTMNRSMSVYVDKMRDTMAKIQELCSNLAGEAEESKNASGTLNEQAEKQTEASQNIRESMTAMSNAVSELAENATELAQAVSDLTEKGNSTNDTMQNLVVKANKGQKDMDDLKDSMGNLHDSMTAMNTVVEKVNDSAKEINKIIEMINSIAEQTNLLSLNASIEAARAGESGKGFAVVASEIGKLATDSASATGEIAKILDEVTSEIGELSKQSEQNMTDIEANSEIVTSTSETFSAINQSLEMAGETIKDMIEKMNNVNDIATNVAAISEEQSASSQEVAANADKLVESAENVADESKGVNDSADVVTRSSEQIGSFVNSFKI
jgi:methyl-accepting chemotaxis protein